MYRDIPTAALLDLIAFFQKEQMQCPPKSATWKRASNELAPLFAEMARRQQEAA